MLWNVQNPLQQPPALDQGERLGQIMAANFDAYGGDVRIIDYASARVHALTDDDGLPVKLVITHGQTHDIQVADNRLLIRVL